MNDSEYLLRSFSSDTIFNECNRFYLVTICRYNVKDKVQSSALKVVIDFINDLDCPLGICIYEWCEEFGSKYQQRHVHMIVGSDEYIDYNLYSRINGFRVHWKQFPHKDMQNVRKYLRKDVPVYEIENG